MTALATTPNILIVDDEPGIRQYICECLASQSYRCLGVESPQEALAVSHQLAIDVALLDLTMPQGDGLTLARQLRRENRDLAVVLVTGMRSFETAVEAMRIGVLDYLLKPFTLTDLLDVVKRAVDWREAALRARKDRARLQYEVTQRTARLGKSLAEVDLGSSMALQALLSTITRRNPDGFSHACRVKELSTCVAVELGMHEPMLGHIERAALLHEVGKIAIPDTVFHKATPLTTDEIALMRSHVQIGHDIAVRVPFLRPAAEIVLATRERYDGKGYPRGLAADDIPLGARIISVVDVFDGLTSPRAYRDPASVAAANAELVRTAGTHFDPAVVAAWLRCADAWPFGEEQAASGGVQ